MNNRYANPDMVERTDKDMNSPQVNLNPSADKVPEDAVLIHETSMEETIVHETPMEETIVHETPVDETIIHETPVNETIVHETPMGEMIVQETSIEETVVHETPMGETITHKAPNSTNARASASLLNLEEAENFRTRWNEIQGKFVDEPRSAVEQADGLVTEVIQFITEMFNNEHRSLEAQWNKGSEVSTEDLRIALQRYRSFFNSLVV